MSQHMSYYISEERCLENNELAQQNSVPVALLRPCLAYCVR